MVSSCGTKFHSWQWQLVQVHISGELASGNAHSPHTSSAGTMWSVQPLHNIVRVPSGDQYVRRGDLQGDLQWPLCSDLVCTCDLCCHCSPLMTSILLSPLLRQPWCGTGALCTDKCVCPPTNTCDRGVCKVGAMPQTSQQALPCLIWLAVQLTSSIPAPPLPGFFLLQKYCSADSPCSGSCACPSDKPVCSNGVCKVW